MAGYENDRDVDTCRVEFALQIQPTQSRQTHIENEASGPVGALAFEELCGRLKALDLKSGEPNQALGRSANGRIVLDQGYDLTPLRARLFFASLAP
jgi:hypothetical protein